MASLCSRVVLKTARRSVLYTSIRCCIPGDGSMRDPMDHAVGLEKRELLALASGNDDPFMMKAIKRGPSSKEKPLLVPSAYESRLIGCVCEEEANHVNWMWLHTGQPRRCECGFWFKLQFKQPI